MIGKAAHAVRRWDTVKYQQIVCASYDFGDVVVEFADGGRVRVPASVLVGGDDVRPDWLGLQIEEFHLVVPSSDGDIEIPWDVIRIHSDPEFDAHWASVVGEPVSRELPV